MLNKIEREILTAEFPGISKRQLEILEARLAWTACKQAASDLGITFNTLRVHTTRLKDRYPDPERRALEAILTYYRSKS